MVVDDGTSDVKVEGGKSDSVWFVSSYNISIIEELFVGRLFAAFAMTDRAPSAVDTTCDDADERFDGRPRLSPILCSEE